MKNYVPHDEYYFRFPHQVVSSSESPCSVIDRPVEDDILFVPAEIFNFDELEKSGNLDLFTKNRFSVGSDLDSLDRGIEHIRRSAAVGFKTALSKLSDDVSKSVVEDAKKALEPESKPEP